LYISFAVGATGACAQGKADIAASRHPVSERLMAERLARLGEQTQDALALIVAARIKQQTGERTTKRDFRSRDAQDAIPAAQRSDTSLAALIARAKTLAKGRADLIALANEVESSRGRGRPEGPYVATTVIRGGVTSVLEMRFEGGTLAVIGISGDGATDLDLYVTDEDGKRVCTAEGDSDDEICRFTPRVTATYRIEVRNRGKIANQFLFVSN
jgi:hypothetical protein